MTDNTQKECKGCKYSPEFNEGVYTLDCGDCTRFYGCDKYKEDGVEFDLVDRYKKNYLAVK